MKLGKAISDISSGRFFPHGSRVLCAVSGGADSVALLNILAEASKTAGFFVAAAHVHHGIRTESDYEQAFVEKMCAGLGIELYVKRIDVPSEASSSGDGIESTARRLRYDFLFDAARRAGCGYIATAHHSRDQAETVLMHALRGASIHGVSGMRKISGMLVRPLLDVPPEELRDYLADNGIGFCEDASNSDIHYTRNYIRHVLLKESEKAYPGTIASLCRLAESAARDDALLDEMTQSAAKELLHSYGGGQFIEKAGFLKLHESLRYRLAAMAIKNTGFDPSFEAIEAIIAAFDGISGNLSGGITVSSTPARVYIEMPCSPETAETVLQDILQHDGDFVTPWGKLVLQSVRGNNAIRALPRGDGRRIQLINSSALKGCVIRTRRPGDRIHPFGAPGSKKLNDYYTDKKIDRQLRDYIPVIYNGNEVIWAMGVGIAQCAAVDNETDSAMLFQWDDKGILI